MPDLDPTIHTHSATEPAPSLPRPVTPQQHTSHNVTKQPEQPSSPLRDFMSIAGVLLSALVIAFCLINFVFQSYQVDGPSMQNTLHDGDHLIVWKLSKTIERIQGKQYVPKRGDVIIFSEPGTDGECGISGRQLIKRVTGLPGDHVVYKGTELTIYNQQHPNGYHPDEALPYGKNIINQHESNVDVTVGSNQVFVNGDNRDNSTDSRCFGPLNTDLIAGKLAMRILPLRDFKIF